MASQPVRLCQGEKTTRKKSMLEQSQESKVEQSQDRTITSNKYFDVGSTEQWPENNKKEE